MRFVCIGLLVIVGCASDDPIAPGDPDFERDPSLDIENRSAPGERRSHAVGQNCMQCHQRLGPGVGRFSIGVSVRGPAGYLENPILELYDAPPAAGGKVVRRLDGDALGNIFTTDELGFPDTAYFPVVWSADRTLTSAMPFPTESGACNLCHKTGFEVQVKPPT